MKGCALIFALPLIAFLLVFCSIAGAIQGVVYGVKSAAMAVGVLPTETPTPIYKVTSRLTAALPSSATVPSTSTPLPAAALPPTATPLPTSTRTPRPVGAAPIVLPVELRAGSGWTFIVQGVYILAAIDGASERFVPVHGAYVALVGTLSNHTNKDGCIKGDDFRLISDSSTSLIESSTIEAAKAIFGMDYPGMYRGQCLNYDESAQSFLVFDADPYTYSWLNLQGAETPLGSPLAISSMFQ